MMGGGRGGEGLPLENELKLHNWAVQINIPYMDLL